MKGKICICGGGRTGTVLAAVAGAKGYEVSIYTGHPDSWSDTVSVSLPEGGNAVAKVCATSDAHDAVSDAAVVLLCLPGYMIGKVLRDISPYISPDAFVGSVVCSTGFFQSAEAVLPAFAGIFGFQRVPFISVLERYGHSAVMKGRRALLKMAFRNMSEERVSALMSMFQEITDTPVARIGYLEASITNSNPLLHPSRCYSLFYSRENQVFERVPLFYEEWDDEASRLYVACDRELQNLLDVLPVDRSEMPSVLEYYESSDEQALTHKLRSIRAFHGLPAPMREVDGGYVPDFSHRFFTEDIPFGMQLIRDMAHEHNVDTPVMDMILDWGHSVKK